VEIIHILSNFSRQFTPGHHADVSIGLKLDDPFNSVDFLKGHAIKNDNSGHKMVGSDFLQSFVGRITGNEKVFLSNLLNQKWDWIDDYVQVTDWLLSFRDRLGLHSSKLPSNSK
jgi:hypothetical protein